MANEIKFHISPMTGEPRRCMAGKKPCPVGADAPHFNSKEEAYDYIEHTNADKLTKTFKKDSKNTTPPRENETKNNNYGVQLYAYKDIENFSHGTIYTDGERYYTFLNSDGHKAVNINDNIIKHQSEPLIHKNNLSEPRYVKLFDADLSNEEQFSEGNYVPISVQKFGSAMRFAEAYPVGTIFKNNGFQYRVVQNSGEIMEAIRELNYDNYRTILYPSSELLNGAEIIHKPDIMSARHTEFREKYSPGTVMEIQRKRPSSQDNKSERNLKTFFGLRKDEQLSINYDKQMRIRVMENDGTFIKFRDLDTDKVSELLRDDFNNKYMTNGTSYIQPYLNPHELKQHLAEQLSVNKSYDLYDNNGNKTLVKVNELKYNSVVFSYTEKDRSVPKKLEISNRNLTNGEYTFTNHSDDTSLGENQNALKIKNNLPYGNIYRGDYHNQVKNPIRDLKSEDFVSLVDSQGFVISTSAKVLSNDGKEIILEDFAKGNKSSYSGDSIRESHIAFLKI